MTVKKRILSLVVVWVVMVMAAGAAQARPGDVEYVDQIFTLSPLGDATLVVKHRFDAQTYMVWKQKYGANVSLLRRDWNKMLSQYDIADFKVDQNDMDRTVTITLQARGCVNSKGNGVNEMEFPKEFKMGERVGNVLSFHTSKKLDTEQVLQASTKVVLPQEAVDIKEQTNEAGNPVVVYTMPISAIVAHGGGATVVSVQSAGLLGINMWVWVVAGVVLAGAGFILCVISLFIRKRKAAVVAATR